jgi:hypothetical protein
LNIAEKGADRLSDESSKKADSDSHPENWTDHEHSDPQQPASSSPPKSFEEKNKVRFTSQAGTVQCEADYKAALMECVPMHMGRGIRFIALLLLVQWQGLSHGETSVNQSSVLILASFFHNLI